MVRAECTQGAQGFGQRILLCRQELDRDKLLQQHSVLFGQGHSFGRWFALRAPHIIVVDMT